DALHLCSFERRMTPGFVKNTHDAERDLAFDETPKQYTEESCDCCRPPRTFDVVVEKRCPFLRRMRSRVLRRAAFYNQLQQPFRCICKTIAAVDRPRINATTGMNARRHQDVTAVATHVDARHVRIALLVADDDAIGPTKIEMTTFAGDGFYRLGQFTMLGFQLAQRGLTLLAVDVQHPHARAFAGRNSDVEIGGAPPAGDQINVSRCTAQIVSDCRLFAAFL